MNKSILGSSNTFTIQVTFIVSSNATVGNNFTINLYNQISYLPGCTYGGTYNFNYIYNANIITPVKESSVSKQNI